MPHDGKLMGYNVDYLGAIAAIKERLRESNERSISSSPLSGKLFVIMGPGRAGKALAYDGKEKAKAKELANKVGGEAIPLSELEHFYPEEGMILANTTSVGMKPKIDETPIPKEALKHYLLVFDVIYTPKLTRLLQERVIFKFMKDVSVQHREMKAPKVQDSLYWGKRKNQVVVVEGVGVISTAASSLNKFANDGSFMREFVSKKSNNSDGFVLGSVEQEKVLSEANTPGESSAIVKTEMSANQLAAKAMQLRLKSMKKLRN